MPLLEPLDINYIAGLFDGEGSISIFQRKRQHRKAHTSYRPVYTIVICLGNCHYPVLEKIRDQLIPGANIHTKFAVNKKMANYDAYVINTSNAKAYNFLKAIQPYLHIKNKECDLAINFYEECIGLLKGWGRSVQYESRRLDYETKCEKYKKELKEIRYGYTYAKKSL